MSHSRIYKTFAADEKCSLWRQSGKRLQIVTFRGFIAALMLMGLPLLVEANHMSGYEGVPHTLEFDPTACPPINTELRDICVSSVNNSEEKLVECLTAAGFCQHMRALQDIADANDGNRFSGTSGYQASVDYVASVLEGLGYTVTKQAVLFDSWDVVSDCSVAGNCIKRTEPSLLNYSVGGFTGDSFEPNMIVQEFSTSGAINAPVEPVGNISNPCPDSNCSNSGCSVEDFSSFTPGNIALVERGGCTFETKKDNAVLAGASALIVYNDGATGREDALDGAFCNDAVDCNLEIPVFFATHSVGAELYDIYQANIGNPESELPKIHISLETEFLSGTADNVIAENPLGGKKNTYIMLGAHLDSVKSAPGINDDGSGVAAVLEIATMLKHVKPLNRMRFVFWAAEELGGQGTAFYLNNLGTEGINDISYYLDLDIIAAPNYATGPTWVSTTNPPSGVSKQTALKSNLLSMMYNNYFDANNIPTTTFEETRPEFIYLDHPLSETQGLSTDSFIVRNIPIVAIANGYAGAGSLSIKSEEDEVKFGGIAGEETFPCYHRPCDTFLLPDFPLPDPLTIESLGNINLDIGIKMTQATGAVLLQLLFDKQSNASSAKINVDFGQPKGERTGHGRSKPKM